eukprot:RCo035260
MVDGVFSLEGLQRDDGSGRGFPEHTPDIGTQGSKARPFGRGHCVAGGGGATTRNPPPRPTSWARVTGAAKGPRQGYGGISSRTGEAADWLENPTPWAEGPCTCGGKGTARKIAMLGAARGGAAAPKKAVGAGSLPSLSRVRRGVAGASADFGQGSGEKLRTSRGASGAAIGGGGGRNGGSLAATIPSKEYGECTKLILAVCWSQPMPLGE